MAVMTTSHLPVQVSGERRASRLASTLALVAAVIGAIIAFAGWGLLVPIAAIVLGAVAARRERGTRAVWLSAIILGILGLAGSVVSLVLQYLSLAGLLGYLAG